MRELTAPWPQHQLQQLQQHRERSVPSMASQTETQTQSSTPSGASMHASLPEHSDPLASSQLSPIDAAQGGAVTGSDLRRTAKGLPPAPRPGEVAGKAEYQREARWER